MRRVGRTWQALLLIAATSASFARADGPKPAPLARYFPSKDLVAYVEFDGIDAHSAAWKETAARKILDETPAGVMLESVARQLSFVKLKLGEFESPSFDDVSGVVRQLVRSGFALGINRKPGDPSAKPSCLGLVVRGGAKGPIVPSITKLLKSIDLDDKAIAEREKKGGRKIRLFGSAVGPGVAWWAEGDDLAFCFMDVKYADTMIAALEGREPNAVEHPLRKELVARVDGFEPVGLAFLDVGALPEMPAEAAMFGLDGIKRVDVRWGYRGQALESVARVVAPSPRRGVLALFDQPTFGAKALPPRPDGVGSFTTASIDLVATFDRLSSLSREFDAPVLGPAFDGLVEMFHLGTGLRLRDDILAKLGPRFLLADVPTSMLISTNPLDAMARGMARIPRLSLLIEIKDRGGLLKDLEALAKWANEQFPLPKKPGTPADKPAPPLVRRLKYVEAGYEVALSPTYYPLAAGYRPSIVVGEKFLSLGTTPDVARQALRPDAETPPPMARALAVVPGDLTLLSVVDAKNSGLPEMLANIPSFVQWWAFAIQGFAAASRNPAVATSPTISVPATAERMEAAPSKLEIKPDGTLAAVGEPIPQLLPPPEPPPKLVTRLDGTLALVPQPRPQPPQAAATVVTAPAPAVPEPGPSPAVPNLWTFPVRLRLDPDEIPTPEEIRPFLFPATYSLSADAQGFRFSSSEAFPSWNPTGLAPLAISAALPAFQSWRESTEQERLSTNLRKIGKALGQFHEKTDAYPAPAIVDKQGRPLLSWRVALLPFLGQEALYQEFNLDEAWDSPHNKALIGRMPAAFAHPSAKAEPGLTFYRGVAGKGAFFDPEGPVKVASILDGTMNTLAIVEAKEAVPWTKPGTDLPFEAPPMRPQLGGHTPGKFAALFVDGTVKLIGETIDPQTLRSISTRGGGEVVTSDAF